MRLPLSAPPFWNRKAGAAARLLAPLARLYGERVAARMAQPGLRVAAPVVCVGNFTLGGAGKTPTAIAIAEALIALGEHPFFLSRGYGGSLRGPHLVAPGDEAARVGDEALLLARIAPTIVAADRVAGARLAMERGASVIVMDDGFQNPSLAKDAAFVVVDGATGIGNGLAFPAGPLRAPLHAQTPFATAVIVIGPGEAGARVAAYARGAARPVFQARLEPVGSEALAGRRVLGFAGIGQPEKFRRTLLGLGARVVAFEPFADHHRYTEAEATALARRAQADRLQLVTTEKDLVRIGGGRAREALASMTFAVPVRLTIDDPDGFLDLLRDLIRR